MFVNSKVTVKINIKDIRGMSFDMKTLNSSHLRHSGAFIVNALLLFTSWLCVSIGDFEQVIVSREYISIICTWNIVVFYKYITRL